MAQIGGAVSQTVTTNTAGTHHHSGATVVAGPFTANASTDQQGTHSHTGNTLGRALTITEMPPHDHGLSGQQVMSYPGSSAFVGSGSFGIQLTTEQSQGGGAAHEHSISTDGLHAHNVAVTLNDAHSHGVNFDGTHTHTATVNTLPPFYAMAFIEKL